MRDLMRRIEKLEQELTSRGECTCGRNHVIHFLGEPEPERKECPTHGLQPMHVLEFVSWLLPKSPLDR
jgi:hypothetical protein